MENWKDIEEYEGLYQVSDQGRVKSLSYNHSGKERILKQERVGLKTQYCRVHLYKNGEEKKFLVHRLVAQAFIPNPDILPCVNHKDENPSNNSVNNIEWCTHKYNMNYGTRNQRVAKANTNNPSKSKKVLQFTKEGKFIREFPSLAEAERQTKISKVNIFKCCSGKLKSSGNYIWQYKKED